MFNKESNYIKRTSGPKYSNYTSDGQGRDQYIMTNNGGFQNLFSSAEVNHSLGKYYHPQCLLRNASAEPLLKINWQASNAE